jgi:hypothetical protein
MLLEKYRHHLNLRIKPLKKFIVYNAVRTIMKQENYIWEKEGFRKDPYTVPDGYFAGFQDRMMDRLSAIPVKEFPARTALIRPWMAWVSGIAAILVAGWLGVHAYFLKPLEEERFQEKLSLLVDYYGEELHEGKLADYFEDNSIEVNLQSGTEVNEFIQIDPDLAEEYIYESVGF